MSPVDLVGRVTFWEMELPSLERYRQRSPFGKDCSGSLCILGVGGSLWEVSLEERNLNGSLDFEQFSRVLPD